MLGQHCAMGAQGMAIEIQVGRIREGCLKGITGKLSELTRCRAGDSCSRKKEQHAKAWHRGEVVPEARTIGNLRPQRVSPNPSSSVSTVFRCRAKEFFPPCPSHYSRSCRAKKKKNKKPQTCLGNSLSSAKSAISLDLSDFSLSFLSGDLRV